MGTRSKTVELGEVRVTIEAPEGAPVEEMVAALTLHEDRGDEDTSDGREEKCRALIEALGGFEAMHPAVYHESEWLSAGSALDGLSVTIYPPRPGRRKPRPTEAESPLVREVAAAKEAAQA